MFGYLLFGIQGLNSRGLRPWVHKYLPKSKFSFALYTVTYFLLQEFDKAISDALEYAKTRKPQGRGREGLSLAREGEVRCYLVYYII